MTNTERLDIEDTEYMNGITCPYCGYIDPDSLEQIYDDNGSYKCHDCGKISELIVNIDISYCTYKKEIKND